MEGDQAVRSSTFPISTLIFSSDIDMVKGSVSDRVSQGVKTYKPLEPIFCPNSAS